jgi:AcrR family transcriptional regulator
MAVRQARSVATRRKIIDGAVELFDEMGYPHVGLGDIVERAGLTKGALYHHFESKEALAVAIIEEGSATLLGTYQAITRSPAPALESMIHGAFVTAELGNTDKLVRVGARLLQIFATFSEVSTVNYRAWLDEIARQARRAQAEGDLRADIDAQWAGEFIVSAMLGTEVISNAVSGGADLIVRVSRTWELLLSAVASEQSRPYLFEYLGRESLRRGGRPQLAT